MVKFKKILYLMVLVVFITAFGVAKNKSKIVTLATFSASVDSMGIQFTMPAGYKETSVKQYAGLPYDFAIKHTSADFEIRYTLFHVKPMMAAYNKCMADTACKMQHPDYACRDSAQVYARRMSGQYNWGFGSASPEYTRKNFNADECGGADFKFTHDFGKGYRYGEIMYLHKNGVAGVLITFMGNNKTQHDSLVKKAFHALTFK